MKLLQYMEDRAMYHNKKTIKIIHCSGEQDLAYCFNGKHLGRVIERPYFKCHSGVSSSGECRQDLSCFS